MSSACIAPTCGSSRLCTRASAVLGPRTGRGSSIAHYGELFQGQIEDAHGALRRCLLSLPCSSLYSRATFSPDLSASISVKSADRLKARRVAELTLSYLEESGIGGSLEVVSNISPGKGCGSSTADCVAAAIAVADAVGQRLTPTEIARLVVQGETASDNVMFDHGVLFAQREGVVLEDYVVPVPSFEVIGVDTNRGGSVDTLAYPPAIYNCTDIQCFDMLLGALRYSVRAQDRHLLARVATASAIINERFLPKPYFAEIHNLASRAGALGVAVAHSGTVLSLLLDPEDVRLEEKVELIATELRRLSLPEIFRFRAEIPRNNASLRS